MILRSSLAAVVLFAAFGASAQPAPVTNSRMVPAQVQPGTDAALDERQAREWGLQPEEWARYRQLMQGPLGVYSPQLDPLTALGIEARSEEERRRYAELQVQAEARRVGKALAYQRAYDAAWQRLFPGQPRVSLPGAKAQGAGNTGSGRWRSSSRPTAHRARSACSSCRRPARPSISTWSAAVRTTRASGSGPPRRASTRPGCALAPSRSTTMRGAGCRSASPAICRPWCAR